MDINLLYSSFSSNRFDGVAVGGGDWWLFSQQNMVKGKEKTFVMNEKRPDICYKGE